MSHTLEEIRNYWNSRAEGYTQSNREELEGESRIYWEKHITEALRGQDLSLIHIYLHFLSILCGVDGGWTAGGDQWKR